MKASNFHKTNPEIMKEYSLEDLQRKTKITLSLGDIVALKALAIRKNFTELADKLRAEEKRLLANKKGANQKRPF